MTERVNISSKAVAITIFIMALLVGLMLSGFYFEAPLAGYMMAITLVGLCVAALFFIPLSVSAGSEELTFNFVLRNRAFPLSEIADVCPWVVGSDAIRVCGSGGWFGYWGWFRSRSLGKFFGYFGDPNQCILLQLKNGRYYVIGCAHPDRMVYYLKNEVG